jgi:hypothetical protein
MAQAETSNITRRALALAAIGAAVGAAIPSQATAASNELRQLWQERSAVHIAREEALEAAAMSSAYEGPIELAAERAIAALWKHDDRIMGAPVTSLGDLAIKASVIEARFPEAADGADILMPYIEQLVADVMAIAS